MLEKLGNNDYYVDVSYVIVRTEDFSKAELLDLLD
jgi:hypothetical protein